MAGQSWDLRAVLLLAVALGSILAAALFSSGTGEVLAGTALLALALGVAAQALARHPAERGLLPPRRPVDDAIRKQRLTQSRLDALTTPADGRPIDTVVIGSGMGGLSCGAMLSRQGQKVLVLEQHDVAGGSTHTFLERGVEFDTGLHYIGGPAFGTGQQQQEGTHLLLQAMTEGCAEGPLAWTRMDEDYDIAIQGSERFAMCAGRDKLQSRLVSRFPAEEGGIKRYFAAIDTHQSRGGLYFGSKAVLGLLPGWLAGWLRPLLTRAYHEGSDRTVAEVSTTAC
eukprot:COSAG04_NODE_61_length_30104_cov_10.610932_10_plen_283_part_00